MISQIDNLLTEFKKFRFWTLELQKKVKYGIPYRNYLLSLAELDNNNNKNGKIYQFRASNLT